MGDRDTFGVFIFVEDILTRVYAGVIGNVPRARVKAGITPEGQVCAGDTSKTKTIEVHIIGMSFQLSVLG